MCASHSSAATPRTPWETRGMREPRFDISQELATVPATPAKLNQKDPRNPVPRSRPSDVRIVGVQLKNAYTENRFVRKISHSAAESRANSGLKIAARPRTCAAERRTNSSDS